MMEWSDEEYSVGIPEIDEQHKMLFNLVNTIHAAIYEHKGTAACVGVLEELADYTRVHFALEENLMQQGHFPGFLAHRELHHALVNEVVALLEQIHAGQAKISFQLLHFLRSWLKQHIQGEDKKYGAFFAQFGSGDNYEEWVKRSAEAFQRRKEEKWWKFW